jgi:8-amino-7-oxononanoate synthase
LPISDFRLPIEYNRNGPLIGNRQLAIGNFPNWLDQCSRLLSQRRELSLFRQRQIVHPIDAMHVEIDGIRYVNFSSNNYLGLTHHPRMIQTIDAAQSTGSGAAGLISGYSDVHAKTEIAIAKWKNVEAAVLLPSGYQANLAAVQTLAAIGETYPAGVQFHIDKLVHASLIDAVRATQCSMRVFPHNDLKKLSRLLEKSDEKQLQVVLSESIFSMDGDAADLDGLAKLKQSHAFVLLLDEAHASGVYGPNGAGLAAELQLQNAVDISVVTFSKAHGCIGGAVCSSSIFRDALLNFGRAYIYSTSVPPMIASCIETAIAIMRDEPQRQMRVRALAKKVRAALKISLSDSPIIPIVLGSAQRALDAAEALKKNGLLAVAVRPPTVAANASRVRVTISYEHSDEEIEKLVECLRRIVCV